MTIGTTSNSITVQGNGATTTFAYPFLIPEPSDAVVIFTNADGMGTTLSPTQFTIAGTGLSTGGTVTYPLSGSPIPSGSTLTIERILPLIQATSIANQGPTFTAIENEFDYLTMLIQQINNLAERAIVINPADIMLPAPLPVASVRAGQFLFFDSEGNPTAASVVTGSVVVSSAMQPVVAASTVAEALSLLGGAPLLSFPTIASLQAYTGVIVPSIVINGYYTPGDGGEGTFVYNSGSVADDNGGTIIVDGSGRRWDRVASGAGFSLRQFGCKGDGTTDDTTHVQTAVNAATSVGFSLLVGDGVFLLSSTITSTSPITLLGSGAGVGPGVVSNTGCSIFLCAETFTGGDVFSFTTLYSCIFRDFQVAGALSLGFTSACPRISDAGIHITGPTGHVNCGSVVNNVAFSGMFDGVILTRCNEDTKVQGTYHQAWGNAGSAIYADNGNTATESSCGIIENNQFFGNPTATQGACIEAHCGYGSITKNKFLGAEFGLKVIADQTVSIGSVIIGYNSFEENIVQSILITQTGSVSISSTQIVANQFSNIVQTGIQAHINIQPEMGGSQADLFDIVISGNNFYTRSVGSPGACINVDATNVIVTGNTGTIGAGSMYGVVVGASSANVQVLDNQFRANGGALSGTTGYFFQASTVIRDLLTRNITFALLPANAGPGSEIWVTDGKCTNFLAGNLAVTSGGSGCIAWLMGGGWLTVQT